jgi:hypothetical protein
MVREEKMEEMLQSLYGNMARLNLGQALVSNITLG